MFSDTIALTLNGATSTLTRINQDRYSSEYYLRGTGFEMLLNIRNSKYVDKTRNGGTEVDRHNVEFIIRAPDAVTGFVSVKKWYAVIENDAVNTAADFAAQCKDFFTTFFTVANVSKLLNRES